MSYSVIPNSSNPMAILFVVDQSGSMDDKMTCGKTKAEQVATVINKTISELVIASSKGETVKHYYDVGVIGYNSNGVCNALQGPFAAQIMNPISLFESAPLRIEDRMNQVVTPTGDIVEVPQKFPVWFDPVSYGGTPMRGAMTLAAETIAAWCDAHPTSFPPVVIHITDGESGDGDPSDVAGIIRSLSTEDGNVLLCNLHVSTARGASIAFPSTDDALPDEYSKMLFNMSSCMPSEMLGNIRAMLSGASVDENSRFFTFNGDEVQIVKFIRIGTQGTQPKLVGGSVAQISYGGNR